MKNEENNLIEEKDSYVDTLYDEKEKVTVATEDTIIVKKTKRKLNIKAVIIILVCLVLIASITIVILYVKGIIGNKNNEPTIIESVVLEDNFRYENGKLIFLNNNSDEIGTYDCKFKNSSSCFVAKLLSEDNFNQPTYVFENGKEYQRTSKIYFERYVFINDGDKIYLYDIEKQKEIGNYKAIKTGNIDKYFIVAIDEENKYGLIEIEKEKASFLIDPSLDYLAILNSDSKFVTRDENGNELIIDIQGNAISPSFDGVIKSFDDNNIVVYQNSKYFLYNYNGQVITYDEEFIDLNQGLIVVINNKNLVLYDKDYAIVNEGGIKLLNDFYVKEYIIDNSNALKETKKAYDLLVSEGKIIVEFENNKKIVNYVYNLSDLENSKRFSYVAYISQSYIKDTASIGNEISSYLYFYSDKEKTNLIGSYKCSAQNTDGLNNCFIAKNTNILYSNENAYIPIISNQYAFIYDKGVIVLYDFINDDVISKYTEVESDKAESDIVSINDDKFLITCKNTNDNYGIISIYLDNVNSVVPFKITQEGKAEYTQKISLLKSDYFYVERNGMNYVYNKTGDVVAKSNFEISDYYNGSYVVKEDGKCYVVDSTGQMISDRLDYIELYNEYYVGINEMKLNVYSYDDAKTAILDESLDIYDSNFEKSYFFEDGIYNNVITIKVDDDSFETHTYNRYWNEVS